MSEIFAALGSIVLEINAIYLTDSLPGQFNNQPPIQTAIIGLTRENRPEKVLLKNLIATSLSLSLITNSEGRNNW